MSGFSNIDSNLGQKSKYTQEGRIDHIVDIFKFPGGEMVDVRFIEGPVLILKQHWIKIIGGKDKKELKVSRWCVSFDPVNPKVERDDHCPYCDLTSGDTGSCQTSTKFYRNAIIRDLQEQKPGKTVKPSKEEAKSGFKDMSSDTWTPIRVMSLPGSLVDKLKLVEKRNVHKVKVKGGGTEKKAFPITHEKYGIDVGILFDNDKAGGDKYAVDRGERTPITEDESEYLVYNLNAKDIVKLLGIKDEEAAAKDFKEMRVVGGTDLDDEDDDEEDDDEDTLGSKKKGKKSSDKKDSKKAGKKKRHNDDDEDEDEEEDDDEDDRPAKKKSKLSGKSKLKDKKAGKKKKPVDDDEDEEEDDDEDDRPAKKKKGSASKLKDKKAGKKKAGKKKRRNDDDDDDEDDIPF